MAHQKHVKLKRPAIGYFHRNEWAILGAPCSRIEKLVQILISELSAEFKTGFIDADHHAEEAAPELIVAGASLTYTNKIEYYRQDSKEGITAFESKQAFRRLELLLVNGNHYQAKKQILILDERKFDSLKRKSDRLTDVALILTTPELNQLPEFLENILPESNKIPKISIENTNEIYSFLRQQTKNAVPPIKGLVLAGGKSQRMGKDKAQLVYHNGQTQQQYMYNIMQDICPDVYLSCRADQSELLEQEFQTLPDRHAGLGPFGAILSAFQLDPDAAWLVVACDLPFVNKDSLQSLIHHRDPAKNATAFHNPESGFPEPLITIWEPRAYPDLLHFLSLGYSCPRKVLINTDVHQVNADNPNWIRNINTPEELNEVLQELKKQA